MHLRKPQHGNKSLFFGIVEAPRALEFLRVLIGSEEHVSPDDVAIVVRLTLLLVLNAMHLRPLRDEATGSLDIHVVEELADCGTECISGLKADPTKFPRAARH